MRLGHRQGRFLRDSEDWELQWEEWEGFKETERTLLASVCTGL
jgi:hypothetical protein